VPEGSCKRLSRAIPADAGKIFANLTNVLNCMEASHWAHHMQLCCPDACQAKSSVAAQSKLNSKPEADNPGCSDMQRNCSIRANEHEFDPTPMLIIASGRLYHRWPPRYGSDLLCWCHTTYTALTFCKYFIVTFYLHQIAFLTLSR